MKSKAAILWEQGSKWSVEDIELDDPRQGEVLVKLAASGLCHSDEHLVTGDMVLDPEMAAMIGLQQFPIIGGHEGAGEVVEVGPGVTNLAVGDHVVLSFIPACGRCPSCAIGQQHLCDLGAFLLAGRQVGDFTARHHAHDGTDLGIMCCLGTFEPYTVVNEASCIKIEPYIPLDKAALVGCGVTTGWGSAVNAADVRAGETVVVVGPRRHRHERAAGRPHGRRRQHHRGRSRRVEAGAGRHLRRHPHRRLDGGGAGAGRRASPGAPTPTRRSSPSASPTGDLVAPLMSLVKKGGRAVVTAVAPMAQTEVQLNLFEMAMMRKELVGCIFGNANPRRDIPRLLKSYMDGNLLLDELVTTTYDLEDINQGYQDMRDGVNIRGVITYS